MANDVTVTYFGHACVLVEVGGTRLLLDPGNLTPEFDPGKVDAILITHGHPDHIDADHLERLTATGTIPLYGPADIADLLGSADVTFVAVEAGELDVAGVSIAASLGTHETLYPGVPLPSNVRYLIGGRVFAPGDSLQQPDVEVDVLLAPLAGPWMKVSEGIDYVRAIRARAVVPIHDAGLAPAHRGLHRMLFGKFVPEGCEFSPLDRGESLVV